MGIIVGPSSRKGGKMSTTPVSSIDELPEVGSSSKIYLVPDESGSLKGYVWNSTELKYDDFAITVDIDSKADLADLEALEERVTELENNSGSGEGGSYDDSALITRIEALETKEDLDTVYDDTALKARISDLEARTDNDTIYDDSSILERLTALESKEDKDTVYDESALVTRIEALESKTDNDTIYDDSTLKARIEALELKEDLDTIYDDSEIVNRINSLEDKDVVVYKPFTYGNANRKTILLDNYNSISGIGANCLEGEANGYPGGENLEGQGFNLVMLSKWNVADFGSTGVKLNLNTKDGKAYINDDKEIATVDQIPSLENYALKSEVPSAYDDTELRNAITVLNGTEDGSVSKQISEAIAALTLETDNGKIDTLAEVIKWINDNPNTAILMQAAITANTNALEEKVNKSDYDDLVARVEALELVNQQLADMLDELYALNLILILNGSNEGVATDKTTEELINELNYGNS